MKKAFPFLLLLFPVLSFAQQINQQQKANNLAAFARLYGYVRYFHPSDEASAINWEEFLYYSIPEIEKAGSKEELARKLNFLFNPIAPSVLISTGKNPHFSMESIKPSSVESMKDVFWQHLGLGISPGFYKSGRINRKSLFPADDAPKVMQRLNPKPYRGKHFRLRSAMRTDGGGTLAQMWISINTDDGNKGFFYNMSDRPVKSTEWKEYEIEGQISGAAAYLTIGAFVRGNGNAWIDNFHLEVKEIDGWKEVGIVNRSFEDSSAPGGWTITPDNKFWIVTDDVAEGKRALLIRNEIQTEIFNPIFSERPAFGDYVLKNIGSGITCIVPLVLKGTSTQTYPAPSPEQMEQLSSISFGPLPKNISSTNYRVRIAGVIIAWNIFRHFYPYHDEAGADWDAELIPALKMASQIQKGKEYISLLRKMTEKLKDGHIGVTGPETVPFFSIPATAAYVQGQVVIDRIAADLSPDSSLLKSGDVVTRVNETPALTVLKGMKDEISGSEQWKMNRALVEMFCGAEGTEIALTIKRGSDAEKEIRLIRRRYRTWDNKPSIKKLNDDTYYVNLGTTPMEDIQAAGNELLSAKALIFDLRGYPRGNSEVIRYLLKEPDTTKWLFVPKITRPDFERVIYDTRGWDLTPAEQHTTARVIFLTGGGAISYAESFIAYIKHYKLATIVGEATAGANGDVNRFNLPGNYIISFSGLKVKQQDGSQLHAIGIQPDIRVSRTIKGIAEGRDEYLDKALEILKKGTL